MKKILLTALLVPAMALAQTFPSPTFNSLTLQNPLTAANGGTGATTATGTGSVVLSNSPALTTPNLGTPSAVTLTNGTGLPVSTGISGLGTGVATGLGNAATGTGSPVLATSPSISTPAIAGGSVNNATVGATTPSTGAFTTLSASGTVSGSGFNTYLASPPAIGGTTANTGAFTGLSSTSQTVGQALSGTAVTSYTSGAAPGSPTFSGWLNSFWRWGSVNSVAGSHQVGFYVGCFINPTNTSLAEQDCAQFQAIDATGDGFTNAVGLRRDGAIAGTITNGLAWGGNDIATINPGGDGQLIGNEIDVVNFGSTVASPLPIGTTKMKVGLWLANFQNPATAAIGLNGTGWQNGLWAQAANFPANANYIWLDNNSGSAIYSVSGTGVVTSTGSTSGSFAASGMVGQTILHSSSGTSLTTGVTANATSFSVPAGNWNLQCSFAFIPGASTTTAAIAGGVTTTSATFPANYFQTTQLSTSFTAGQSQVISTPVFAQSFASATTVFCVAFSAFGVSTMGVNGTLTATRIN
jgi:hypothetical protein